MNKIVSTGILASLVLSGPAMAQVMSASEYVATAGAGDMYERQSSELVLTTTSNPALRSFADMMVAQHTKSTAEVKAAAKQAKLKPRPAMLTPSQTEMIAQLRAEAGTARDAAYVAQQKAAHGQALAVHQAYADGGLSPPLKAAATAIVPAVQAHIIMLMKM